MGETGKEYVNKHGRKAGRGLRPWLLIPKVLAAGTYLGILVATAAMWFMENGNIAAGAGMDQRQIVEFLSVMFRFVVVPVLLVALIFGVLLFLQHPMVFLRMRWLQLKLMLIVIFVPLSHFFMSSRLGILREACIEQKPWGGAENETSFGLIVVVLVTMLIIFLGRQKPRLGQNWAKTYDKLNKAKRKESSDS